MIFLKRKT